MINASEQWRSADQLVQRCETDVIRRIKSVRKSVEFAYNKGAIGSLDLIDAERNYPDGPPKLPHLWPVTLLQAGRSDDACSGVAAIRAAASLRR